MRYIAFVSVLQLRTIPIGPADIFALGEDWQAMAQAARAHAVETRNEFVPLVRAGLQVAWSVIDLEGAETVAEGIVGRGEE